MNIEQIHEKRLNEYSESLTASSDEERQSYCECNQCGHSFYSDEADVYKCERCGSNDLNIEEGIQ